MNSVNKLGLMAVVVTVIVLAGVYGIWRGVRPYLFPEEVSPTETAQEGDVSQDSDGDGLADLVENLYKTDPNNPDTDGDGVSDGEEVQAGRNPTLAEGPGDILGDVLIGSAVENPQTWTEKYLASLPDDTLRSEILNQDRLEAFVNVNRGALLPNLPEEAIQVSQTATTGAYLDAITPATNPLLNAITNQDIEAAWRISYQNGQREDIEQLVGQLHENVDILEKIEAPAELEELHVKVVAASHALTNNAELLRDMNQDFVGGLIGAKNIELLTAVFAEIEAEIDKLDEGLE